MEADAMTFSPPRMILRHVPWPSNDRSVWVYQAALPFQLSANEAAAFLNIRRGGEATIDFEAGTDLAIFRDPADLAGAHLQKLYHGGAGVDERTGREGLFSAYPMRGGFVPRGATLADGRPHPHAGTGFGVCLEILLGPSGVETPFHEHVNKQKHLVMQQYRYDGTEFHVLETSRVAFEGLLDGWRMTNLSLCNAIEDGEDLLLPFCGGRVGDEPALQHRCGVSRWRRIEDRWRMEGFTPILNDDRGFEPSLVRDAKGELLFTCRPSFFSHWCERELGKRNALVDDVWLWRSRDGGRTWEQTLDAKSVRNGTPVTIAVSRDGKVFFIVNPFVAESSIGPLQSIERRETLAIIPVSDDRRSLGKPQVFFDSIAEFGPSPHGAVWRGDHPVCRALTIGSATKDLLFFRVLEKLECTGALPPTPQTGCYCVEVA